MIAPPDHPTRADPRAGPPPVRQLLGQAAGFLAQGQLAACREAVERALELEPRNPDIMAFLGHVFLLMGQFAQARRWLESAVAARPGQIPLLIQLAGVCLKLQDWAAFKATLAEVLGQQPERIEALRLLANFCALRGSHHATILACGRILDEAPKDIGAQWLLAQSFLALGEFSEARRIASDLLALQPGNREIEQERARLDALLARERTGNKIRPGAPWLARFLQEGEGGAARFPGLQARMAWADFRRLFIGLCTGTAWSNPPSSPADWGKLRVPGSWYLPVSAAAGSPAAEITGSLSLPEAFEELDLLYDHIQLEFQRDAGARPVSYRECSARRHPPSRNDEILRRLQSPPSAIAATLLLEEKGESTSSAPAGAKILCVVKRPAVGGGTFWEAAQWLFELHQLLGSTGPGRPAALTIAFEAEFDGAAEVSLPSDLLCRGEWCHGGRLRVAYHDGIPEMKLAEGGGLPEELPAQSRERRSFREILLQPLPRALDWADFAQARAVFLARCRRQGHVRAVFEFGDAGCPGHQRLKLGVMLSPGTTSLPRELRVSSFPEEIAHALGRDPHLVPAVSQLDAFAPAFSVRQIWGDPIEAGLPAKRRGPAAPKH